MPDEAQRYRNMTDYLSRLYRAELFKRHGVAHPVVVLPPGDAQRADVDGILGRMPTQHTTPDDFALYNHALLQSLRNSKRKLYNGTTFALKHIRRRGDELKIEAVLGSYFDMLATCITLEDELRAAADKRAIRVPGRTQLHRDVPAEAVILSGKGRSAAIGGNVLVIYRRDDAYHAMLMRRNPQAGIDPDRFHVMPAFIFQPQSPQVQAAEWSLRYHIEREYLEELFGLPETEHAHDPHYFAAHPALQDLHTMLADGRALLHLTGIAINLLTLRPEICFLLLIHDAEWFTRITAAGSPTPFNAESEAAQVAHIPILSNETALAALPADLHTRMPPHATAALWLGIEHARQLIAQR